MKNIVIIPARAGSKGIINKNIRPINNKPLISWTIESCLHLKDSYEIIVATNMKEIKEIAKDYRLNCEYPRPNNLSTDQTSMFDTVSDIIYWLENKENIIIKNILLLQPTNPLRLQGDVNKAIEYLNKGCESCFSITPSHQSPYETITFSNERWSYLKEDKSATRRQEYKEEFWFIDGSIYACTKNFLETHQKFIVKGISLPIKCEINSSWDIDSPIDLLIAESMINYYKK